MSNLDFNTSPYYDDYDENKNFHRILFKPGVSVQARELTQLQTILQKQIERHGTHVFKEGANVVGGELTFTPELDAIKIKTKIGVVNVADFVDDLVGVVLVGETSGVRAKVVAVSAETDTDPLTLFVNYIGTGANKVTDKFVDEERLLTESDVYTYQAGDRVAVTIADDASAVGVGASIALGVFYIKGAFVLVQPQTIVISKYTTDVDARLGLLLEESIVNSEDDASLLDNAQGSPNFAAPGADRYVMELTLTSIDEDSVDDENFIELERIRNGQLQGRILQTEYSKIEESIAQRSFEQHGNVEIKPFSLKIRESVRDFQNLGVYAEGETTASGNTAAESLMALQVSEGIVYVDGYRLETAGSIFVDVEKARDFEEVTGAAATLEVGNYLRVNNLNSLPDIVDGSGSIPSYELLELRDTFTDSAGVAQGTLIGRARAKSMEYDGGTSVNDVFDSDATFKLHLFDVNMFTTITLDSDETTSNTVAGSRIRGVNSYASGIVDSSSTTGVLNLTSVSGLFEIGEALSTNNYDSAGDGFNIRNAANTRDVTVGSISTNSIASVKQVYYDDATNDFTADVVLDNSFTLSGTVSISGSSASLSGFNTAFESELRVGDQIELPTGASGTIEKRIVASIASDTSLTLTENVSNTITSTSATRKRAKFFDQSKNLSLRKLSKEHTKTLSNRTIEVRKQFLATTSSGVATISSAGATFNAESNIDYQIAVLSAGDGSAQDGDIINVDSISITGDGTDTLTLTSVPIFGDGCDLKITATIRYASASAKTKTNNKASLLKVENKKNDDGVERPWGTSAHHDEISLGVADTYEVLAVYDSMDVSVDATTPSAAVTGISGGPFTDREVIVGGTSGASAIILDTSSPFRYVLLSDLTFEVGETITGETSGATGTIASLTAGSTNIINRYLLDDGQRDNFYDISRLIIKPKAAKPVGELLVVFSYFSHGSGEFFDVTSYSGVDYKEIPYYGSNRIDPEVRNPTGLYDLRSTIDYRPRVADATRTGPDGDGAYKVTSKSIGLASRSYSGTGSSIASTPKDNSNFSHDFEYYLPRIDSVFLTTAGNFVVVKGVPSEFPRIPDEINSALKICDVYMNAYVIDIDNDVEVQKKTYKNFRKEDIARLEQRINNIEYYTALTLLEQSASRLQITDENGLDRFKSGFLVDNFGGHKVGEVTHPDYRCGIDTSSRTLRTKQSLKNVDLKEKNVTDAARTVSGYKRTGDLVTLPYTEIVTVNQPYATRVENLNPELSFSWTGSITLTPSADQWFDVEYAPDITINREGNFDAIRAANRREGRLGTVVNIPQLVWTGIRVLGPLQNVLPTGGPLTTTNTEIADTPLQVPTARRGLGRIRTIIPARVQTNNRSRWGIETSVVERIDTRLENDRQIASELIPFIRANRVEFSASGLLPNTRVYPFFDNVNVSSYVTTQGGSIVGSTTTRAVTAAGSWTKFSGVTLKDFWMHDRMANPKTVSVKYSTTGNRDFDNQIGSDYTETSRSRADLTFSAAVDVDPSASGDLWIEIQIDPTEHFSWSDIEFLDQDDNPISRDIIELESFRNVRYAGASSNTWAFNTNSTDESNTWDIDGSEIFRRNSRVSVAVFRVRDGAKSVEPASGTILITDNSTIESSALVTDAVGRVSGVFNIPDPNVVGNPKFRTGTRKFRLTSNSDNSNVNVETFADAEYTATGIMNVRQRTFIATRNGEVVTRPRPDDSFRPNTNALRFIDPLAQSVKLPSEDGEFITKIDVYFASKDTSIPVELQLREMENGQITDRIIPSSRVVLEPEQITTSEDASAATSFVFSAPVFVSEVEFAIVLLTNSEDYTVFISRMGEVDIQGGRTVSKQPYLGVLFKSQNNSTWTAYDFEDLKFKIYRAKFDTTTNGVLQLQNLPVPNRTLESDPIECFAGSSTIKVSHYDHQMYNTNNNVKISGVTSNVFASLNGAITSADSDLSLDAASGFPTSGTVALRIINSDPDYVAENYENAENGEVSEIVTGTISGSGSTRTVTGMTRGISPGVAASDHDDNLTVELYQYNGIQLQNINKTHTAIIDYGLDYYTLNATDTATDDLTFGGSNVLASENVMMTSYQLLVPSVVHTNTSLSVTSKFTSGSSANGSETSFSTLAAESATLIDTIELSSVRMIASPINETNELSGSKSATITLTLASTTDNLSPVVDLERMSVVAMANRLNNIESSSDHYPTEDYISPTAPEGDLGEGIYITKQVQLKTPATALKVYLDASVFSSSDVKVMYKTLRSDESTIFDELGWKYFNTAGEEDELVSSATSVGQFQEYEYTANELPEFISFAIKIKMDGTNCAVPPIIKDLRAIALAA